MARAARRQRNRIVRRKRKTSAVLAGVRLTDDDLAFLRGIVLKGHQGKDGPTLFRPFAGLDSPKRVRKTRSGDNIALMSGQKELQQFVKGGGWRAQMLLAKARKGSQIAKGFHGLYQTTRKARAEERALGGKPKTTLFVGYPTYRRLSPRARQSVRRALKFYASRPRFIVKYRSESGKMGPGVTATYSPRRTCPGTCSFYNDCYANEGNVRANWILASLGLQGLPWKGFIKKLRASPDRKVRVNIAGDLPGDGKVINRQRAFELASAASADGSRVAWTYTHYPVTQRNLETIDGMQRRGLKVNLSSDTLREADRKADLGFDVAVVLPANTRQDLRTPAGRRVLKCPAIMAPLAAAKLGHKPSMGETCSACGGGRVLCAQSNRTYVIGFPAHGQQRRKHIDPDAGEVPTVTFAGRSLPTLTNPRRRRWARR